MSQNALKRIKEIQQCPPAQCAGIAIEFNINKGVCPWLRNCGLRNDSIQPDDFATVGAWQDLAVLGDK